MICGDDPTAGLYIVAEVCKALGEPGRKAKTGKMHRVFPIPIPHPYPYPLPT